MRRRRIGDEVEVELLIADKIDVRGVRRTGIIHGRQTERGNVGEKIVNDKIIAHCVGTPAQTGAPSFVAANWRAVSRAAGSLAGSLPPAWAMSGLPPPLPPVTCAASRTQSPALR